MRFPCADGQEMPRTTIVRQREREYCVGVSEIVEGAAMKISAVVGLAIFIGPILLAAQGGGTMVTGLRSGANSAQSATLTTQLSPNMCPVSLRAQHQADGSMVKIRRDQPMEAGQGLHLTLVNPPPRQIVAAVVTIHGWSNKARITETGSSYGSGNGSSDMAKTMTVHFSAAASGSVTGDVRVAGMTAVERIDLESVVYADGGTENFTAQQACRVTPDPLMLIAGR
jgi:hypothetical protein